MAEERLRWYGDDVKKKVMRACVVGVNRTMAVCVAEAKHTHPFTNRTGTAERSIRIARPAQVAGDAVFGLWGSLQVAYFKWLELGTQAMRAKRRRAGQASESAPWKGGSFAPTLRPVALRVYPLLGRLVNQAYRSL